MVSALDLRKRNNNNVNSHHFSHHYRSPVRAEFFRPISTVVTYS
ncbi:hypothetical protein HMPREF0758_3933 [Serratia odorifera DSM 4582]|uniref:Uncharacterized protein n=1 Tax=Serratia odorifera DSM 4582 TaxID=667129 RepID=D4E6Y3_SEROD|nr:hypothetical protein HMPREF0758_3933 [Serratia odorifera DSM 4582]